jgi:uncharacterized coiled-coil protein SlyX
MALSMCSTNAVDVQAVQRWVAVSDDIGSISFDPSITTGDSEQSVMAAPDANEVRALRQLLLEKTVAIENMRLMIARSEHCHRMSIAGLSKCISQQQQIIEQNSAAMAELTAKFAKDAKFVGETLGKYLDDKEPPSADLQGEIGPGFWVVRRDALDVDLDDLPTGAN